MSDSDDTEPLSHLARRRKLSSRAARASNQDTIVVNVDSSSHPSRTDTLSSEEDLGTMIANLRAAIDARKGDYRRNFTDLEFNISNMRYSLKRQEHKHRKMEERLVQNREEIEVAQTELSSLEKEYESWKATMSAREGMLERDIEKLEKLPTQIRTLLDGTDFESKEDTIAAMQRSFCQDVLRKHIGGDETAIPGTSNISLAQPQRMDEDTKAKLKAVLLGLRKHDAYQAFAHPVTEELAPRYFEYIKHPMDISTIRKKLESDEYTSVAEFIADAELMFNNCRTYNNPTSPYVEAAGRLQQRMQQGMTKQGLKWD